MKVIIFHFQVPDQQFCTKHFSQQNDCAFEIGRILEWLDVSSCAGKFHFFQRNWKVQTARLCWMFH